MTCHFNLRHMISVHVSALFKKLFITEAISTYQVITVPKNMTCYFNLRHMISVHVSALFKQRFFITKSIREKV